MANQLNVATVAAIYFLADRGCSNRRVARLLDVNRGTVGRYLASRHLRKKGEATSHSGPRSSCAPFHDLVRECIDAGYTARAIHAKLVAEYGFRQCYPSVQRFVRKLRSELGGSALTSRSDFTKRQQEWLVQLFSGKWSSAEVTSQFDGREVPVELMERLRNGREKDRKKVAAVMAGWKGFSIRSTALTLGLNRNTVRSYRTKYADSGSKGLFAPIQRGPRKVDQKVYKDAVISVLHAPPSAYGINRTTWKQEDLQRVLKEEKGLSVSRRCISEILKKAGYRWRKAKRVLTSTDPDYRAKLKQITSTLAGLSDDERFFSIDEFGPFNITMKPGRKLVAPGEEHTVPQRQKSKGRLILTAALELQTNQVVHFYSEKKNTAEMIRLLDVLLCTYSGMRTLFLSWDAASWHMSREFHKKIRAVNVLSDFGLRPRIKLIPLPACAQFLNVIESVFSGMARAIIHNSNYSSPEEAKNAIDRYFADRNEHYQRNPKRAGDKLWGKERTPPVFSEGNVCKDPLYR